ncbi:hypothetical protein IM40_05140 [Candidatus Paracaedimonas acanthamoebae]|nr:hypothetical protein IM40_05140 [Candidatus Paracaedimonas acanthamoebae]
MKQKLFTFFMVTLLSLGQGAANLYCQHTVTIKSSVLSFMLSYPYDWHCENEHGLPKNIQALLIPQAFVMDVSPATIYVRVVPHISHNPSLQQFIKNDFQHVKKQRPHIQYGTDFVLTTQDHKKAQVRTYFEEPQGLYDAIGYIAEKEAFVIIILQATSQKAYLRALPTFRNLVISYQLESPQEKIPQVPLKKKNIKPKKKKSKKRKASRKSQPQSIKC